MRIRLYPKMDYTAMGLTPDKSCPIQEHEIPDALYHAIHARGMFDAFYKLDREIKDKAYPDMMQRAMLGFLKYVRNRWMEEIESAATGMTTARE